MSDRRFVVVLVAALGAVFGLGMLLVSLFELADPVSLGGEGERLDIADYLIRSVATGAVVLITCAGTAVGLVLHHLRAGATRGGAASD